jgi:hypothetical protein
MAYPIVNQGATLTYNFTGGTGAPSVEFSGKTSFSTAFASMSIGSEYTWYVSTKTNRDTTVSDIIDKFDGIKSDKKNTPVKGSKTAPSIPSTQVTLSSKRGSSLVFDVLYDTQNSGSYNDENFKIKIIDKIGSGFAENEALKLSYFYYGSGGNVGITSGGEYQISGSLPSSAGDNGYVKLTTSDTSSNLSAVTKFEIAKSDLNGVNFTSLYELVYNLPNSFLTIRKENSTVNNVYKVSGGSTSTYYIEFTCAGYGVSSETFSVNDGLYFSFSLAGESGSSGSSGTSGSSGSSGTSGSSGSSGTSGSSGSSGTSGSSGSSGTSGSSGSSGTSGSSGSSGTSGSSGSSGTSGSSGNSGTSGSSGSSGTSGSSGSSGTSGSSGSSGTSGSSGSSGTSGHQEVVEHQVHQEVVEHQALQEVVVLQVLQEAVELQVQAVLQELQVLQVQVELQE